MTTSSSSRTTTITQFFQELLAKMSSISINPTSFNSSHSNKTSIAFAENHNGLFNNGEDSRTEETAKLFPRTHWKSEEDSKLRELVVLHGPQNWNLIAEKLGGRSGKSCRLRWYNQLDPRINRKAFTEEEEERLISAHELYGNRWALIARLFPGRTDNGIKNHWHVIMARSHRKRRRNLSQAARTKPVSSGFLSDDTSLCSKSRTPNGGKDEPLMGFCPHHSFMFALQESRCQNSESIAGANQASATEPTLCEENRECNHFEASMPLPFIDFLGVGTT